MLEFQQSIAPARHLKVKLAKSDLLFPQIKNA